MEMALLKQSKRNTTTLKQFEAILPENSYIKYSGEYRFNEQAVQAIKSEMAKWK